MRAMPYPPVAKGAEPSKAAAPLHLPSSTGVPDRFFRRREKRRDAAPQTLRHGTGWRRCARHDGVRWKSPVGSVPCSSRDLADAAFGRHGDGDRGSGFGCRVNGEAAAMEGGKALDERQAEPRALIAAVEGAVDLAEGFEGERNLLGLHADPGIGDGEGEFAVG